MISTGRIVPALVAATLLAAPAVEATDLDAQLERTLREHAAALSVDARLDGNTVVLDGKAPDRSTVDELVVAVARLPGIDTIVNRVQTG